MVANGDLRLLLDARILAEYSEVLRRPRFQFDTRMVDDYLDYAEHAGLLIATSLLKNPLPDPDDEPFLEVAVAGRAECLITGNLKHFPARCCGGITVLAPSRFIEFYRRGKKI